MNVRLVRVHAASYTASRRVDQYLLFLLNAACLPEKQQISICIVFGMTRSGLEPTIYRNRGEHSNHSLIIASDSRICPDKIDSLKRKPSKR
jgi:hypothetical protein